MAAAGAALLLAALTGCGGSSSAATGTTGDAAQGKSLIAAFGCGSCHTVSGVEGADGEIGPSLDDFVERRYIAGRLPNTPDNLVRWIVDPQEVEPGTVMPDLGVTKALARDIASYLYTH